MTISKELNKKMHADEVASEKIEKMLKLTDSWNRDSLIEFVKDDLRAMYSDYTNEQIDEEFKENGII